jgi:hypothetical protein
MITFQEYLTQFRNTSSAITVEPSWPSVADYRKLRLEESDIAVIRFTEAGLAVPAEWVAYRQALRDITTTYPDPQSVTFPDPPDVTIPPVVTSQEERLEAAELMIDLLLDTQSGGA